ncbi:two-component sensor histidine kinase [Thiorhodococcus mannitoliphagus]|uniref:histidine kinase n=1 Tax=Thiorhodococcus mannitoliphagus TaxID=329406 RepID=A0A6P1DWZ6_9GAMM|nr:ATP-binding protein [Thiorhodococcus mannitoliphagus]NEX21643.1 two-component sensor histidine kinase [Thiorhodococcus mannitoliphagus]
MRSIRHRLLLSLFVVWATIWIAVAAVSLDRSEHEVGELMDAQLAQTAHVLLQITLAGNLPDAAGTPQALSPIGHPYESMISFQLWRQGKLISTFGAAPAEPLAHASGFSDHRIADTAWRVFGLPTGTSDEIIFVAQSYAIRHELIQYLTLHALRPILWSMPLAVLLIWLAITDGLRPLRRLTSQVTHRSAEQLNPMDPGRMPVEIRPLTLALNGLMKRLDRALAAERHFAADASHELRTPFAIIRAHAQIARRSKCPEERDHALDLLLQGIDRASNLISQLLVLSRLHHREGDSGAESCSLTAVAAETIDDKSAMASARGVALTYKSPSDDPVLVDIPPAPLGVLIANLLDNAVKFTPAGGQVRVTIAARREHVLLGVEDSGPGISVEDRARVFDRFYRSAGQAEPGAGLGLSIVRRICDIYDADIELLEAETSLAGLLVEVRFRRTA